MRAQRSVSQLLRGRRELPGGGGEKRNNSYKKKMRDRGELDHNGTKKKTESGSIDLQSEESSKNAISLVEEALIEAKVTRK